MEFLVNGPGQRPQHRLPPLTAGASPAIISRAIAAQMGWPIWILNAGLPVRPSFPCIDLGGAPARCLSTGVALEMRTVLHLFQAGLSWGARLGQQSQEYVILSECVVGGTTTALGVLAGLGYPAANKVNSSHRYCNHLQKWRLVRQGLDTFELYQSHPEIPEPFRVVAALGDPMQIAVAGLALALSQTRGVLLAGGTQMLAVYALILAINQAMDLDCNLDQIVVGTTPWVVDDPSGDTVGLAKSIGHVALMTSNLSFHQSRFPELRAYESGYVKEGVGAGGCAIAAHLHQNWGSQDILQATEASLRQYQQHDQPQSGCLLTR